MKKSVWFIIFLLAAITMNSGVLAITITGESITGKASIYPTNVSIVIINQLPVLSLINPENKTYISNQSLVLNYSATYNRTIWYNLDNSANLTIDSPTIFNTSQGRHILYLYANNTDGNISSANVSFLVNSTKFSISYENYSGSTKGNSTDFLQYSYEDVQDLENVILENSLYGKISFSQSINLTADKNFTDEYLDLDSHTQISNNRIEINSTELPNFNKPAILSIYNLTFNNPRPLKNGNICSPPECTEISYSNGIFKFEISGFSVYSSEETPTPTVPGGDSGGGGGGGSISVIEAFLLEKELPKQNKIILDKEKINVIVTVGNQTEGEIKITNIQNKSLKLYLSSENLENFMYISNQSFELKPGESQIITLNFITYNKTIPDLYVGKVIINEEGVGILESVGVSLEVRSENYLFDVKTKISQEYQTIYPGEELLALISIYNRGGEKIKDLNIEYIIKDDEGNIIFFSNETIIIDEKTEIEKIFTIPKNTKPGDYIFYTRIIHEEKVSSSSSWFYVKKKGIFSDLQMIVITVIIIVILLIILIKRKFKGKKGKDKKDKKNKISHKD